MPLYELERQDLLNLVYSQNPSYVFAETLIEKGYGNMRGGHVERWEWATAKLETLPDGMIWSLYKACKVSGR